MDTVTVNVTAEDIRIGRRGDCVFCPLAFAIGRAVPGRAVFVGTDRVSLPPVEAAAALWGSVSLAVKRWGSVSLPPDAQGFILDFDEGTDVQPFTFVLDAPEETR